MTTPSNPFEVARETLKQLAARRIAPTPDNYLTLYHEIAGTRPAGEGFPEQQLRSLAAALPRSSPDQLRLARQLDQAVKAANWGDYRSSLVDFVTTLAEAQKLAWADLIADLLRQWEAKHHGLTAARKRESLEHILASSGANPEILFQRLQGLLRAWGQGKEGEASILPPDCPPPEIPEDLPATASPADQLLHLRELFSFTLETAIATQLIESPQLAAESRALASDIRKASGTQQLQAFLARLKRFAFKLELLAEDQAELRNSLLGLLRLLVGNVTELVMDDQWLHGQIEVVRDIIEQPLSQRALDDAQRRIREVVFKQSQLKTGLLDAKEAIKTLLAGFVDHLADFADTTSGYHDKIEQCAAKISAAENITQLENVIAEVMRETRNIQINAHQSRDQLRAMQAKVTSSETRIRELEHELETTSDLVRHDQLTGALNRRGLEDMLAKEAARALRHDTTFCVALLDIDNFKKLNDAHGHNAGDQALIHLSRICREALRPQDTVARYGGEEFVIVLPETTLDAATAALTRLQRELTRRFFMHENDKLLITFSAGVTQAQPGEHLPDVLKRADTAMYEAKKAGKNRVLTAPIEG